MAELDSTAAGEAAARQRVLDAIGRRDIADFSSLPAGDRQLSAEFLQRLLSGSYGEAGELCCPLRVRGADITGPLLPPSATAANDRAAVHFRDCTFDSPVDLSGAEFLVLRFIDCEMPAFIGASLRVSADLDLSGCRLTGVSDYESELSHVGSCAVHLNNARIGGRLDFSSTAGSRFTARRTVRLDGARVDGVVRAAGALLDGAGDAAFSARSAIVGGNVELNRGCDWRFESQGEIALVAAHVTGDLVCEAARIVNPGGRALHCEDLKVESVILSTDAGYTNPFEASGRVNFLSAIVGGSFFMTNARLAPGPDYPGVLKKGGPIAVNLSQLRVSNAIAFNNVGALDDDGVDDFPGAPAQPVQGWVVLNGAHAERILDHTQTGWPEYGFLDLEGAVYEQIHHIDRGETRLKRLDWLRRQFPNGVPDAASYRPQPYEQLSRVLRQHGLTREANTVAVEKIRMRLAARVDSRWARLFPRLLMLVSRYGYSTGRAVTSFIVFILLGTALYATALFGFDQPFMPVEIEAEPVTYSFAFGLLQSEVDAGCPGLDVMNYALDAALPVIDLGQDAYCRFTPEGPLRRLWLLLHSAFIIIGTALSAVVVLTLTGVLRED